MSSPRKPSSQQSSPRIATSLAIAAAFIAAALGLNLAEKAGWIAGDVPDRVILVMLGLMAAAYANLAPKNIGRRLSSLEAEARVQTARRIGGWSLTLSGLAYAAIAAVAPISIAPIAAVAVMGPGLLIAVGFGVWACRSAATEASAD